MLYLYAYPNVYISLSKKGNEWMSDWRTEWDANAFFCASPFRRACWTTVSFFLLVFLTTFIPFSNICLWQYFGCCCCRCCYYDVHGFFVVVAVFGWVTVLELVMSGMMRMLQDLQVNLQLWRNITPQTRTAAHHFSSCLFSSLCHRIVLLLLFQLLTW